MPPGRVTGHPAVQHAMRGFRDGIVELYNQGRHRVSKSSRNWDGTAELYNQGRHRVSKSSPNRASEEADFENYKTICEYANALSDFCCERR